MTIKKIIQTFNINELIKLYKQGIKKDKALIAMIVQSLGSSPQGVYSIALPALQKINIINHKQPLKWGLFLWCIFYIK